MNNKTKLLAAILATLIIIATVEIVFFYPSPSKSQMPSGEPPQGQIRITGDIAEEKTLTVKEIVSQMPLTNVTATINGENATYVGVPFYDFCNRTGMLWDVGPVEVISVDGSKATLNIFQAYNSSNYPYYYNRNVIMLAYAKNGQWLTNETGGPLKLIAPYFSAEFQVGNVAEIHFKPWMVSISGKVANPLVIASANLSLLESRTVYAEFAPSVKRWSNWTGLPILNVLQAANVSDRAETITVVAVDGYVKNYTLAQVEEGQMLIGYAENDQPLSHSEGGPFRLFAPTDQYKWAQYWVKFVSEIRVS